jgi:hypothetical protein
VYLSLPSTTVCVTDPVKVFVMLELRADKVPLNRPVKDRVVLLPDCWSSKYSDRV